VEVVLELAVRVAVALVALAAVAQVDKQVAQAAQQEQQIQGLVAAAVQRLLVQTVVLVVQVS
jgi:hypothetical protein